MAAATAAAQAQPAPRQIDRRLAPERSQGPDGAARRIHALARELGQRAPRIAVVTGDDVLPRLFQPFFSTREGGLGLGLTLSESLAQAQGGRLGAGAAPGGGALFSLHLPLDTGTPP